MCVTGKLLVLSLSFAFLLTLSYGYISTTLNQVIFALSGVKRRSETTTKAIVTLTPCISTIASILLMTIMLSYAYVTVCLVNIAFSGVKCQRQNQALDLPWLLVLSLSFAFC